MEKKEEQQLRADCSRLGHEVTYLRGQIILLGEQSAEKDRQVFRTQARLDAVLYALVLMQAQISGEVQALVKTNKMSFDAQSGWKRVEDK